MREIEFRIKDRDKWYYGTPLSKIDEQNNTVVFKSFDGSYYSIFADAKTLGQYTGLKDKNGKKIFEGDFIKARHNDELYKVHWEWFRFIIEDKYGNMILPVQGAIDHFECEVIGNIYDNPELLKGE